jgi:hypothetical protein
MIALWTILSGGQNAMDMAVAASRRARPRFATDIEWLQKLHKWPGLTAIGMVTRIRELTDRCMRETAY